MTRNPSKFPRAACGLAVIVAAVIVIAGTGEQGTLVLGGGEAHAVVGRPATPASYAGVARRTSRRTTRRAVAATTAVTAPGVVYALPGGCTPSGGGVYQCGTVRYRAYYSGPNLVYQPY